MVGDSQDESSAKGLLVNMKIVLWAVLIGRPIDGNQQPIIFDVGNMQHLFNEFLN
jgi:hypothetical protein